MSKTEGSTARNARAAHILAHSLFRDMRENGYECGQILALATELIDQVTKEMRAGTAPELLKPSPASHNLRSVG
jgi:hypothetical protein